MNKKTRNSIDSTITIKNSLLVWDLALPHNTAGWTIIGGGMHSGRYILWQKVQNEDLPATVDPRLYLQHKIQEAGYARDTVSFMTSAVIENYIYDETVKDGISISLLATIGLSNALRVGEVSCPDRTIGTINIACKTNQTLKDGAMLEALSIIAEAKTAALIDKKVTSSVSDTIATGTGTDCSVVASLPGKEPVDYCGKHTLIGQLIGESCYEVISRGVDKWMLNQ